MNAPSAAPGGTNPVLAWTSDCRPRHCEGICFKPPSLWPFVTEPQGANAGPREPCPGDRGAGSERRGRTGLRRQREGREPRGGGTQPRTRRGRTCFCPEHPNGLGSSRHPDLAQWR